MKFNFYTHKINKVFYETTVKEIFKKWKIQEKDFNKWTVNFYPISHSKNNPDFYKDLTTVPTSNKMAWGYTGEREMNFFMYDTNNYFSMLSNVVIVSHEIGHAVGMIIFEKKPKIYVEEVHKIYYKFPSYLTLKVFDKKIRILNLENMMQTLRYCEIGWLFKKNLYLTGYSIYYYKTKFYLKVKILN